MRMSWALLIFIWRCDDVVLPWFLKNDFVSFNQWNKNSFETNKNLQLSSQLLLVYDSVVFQVFSYQRVSWWGSGRTGDKLWCRSSCRRAPAALRHRSGNTRPQTSSFLQFSSFYTFSSTSSLLARLFGRLSSAEEINKINAGRISKTVYNFSCFDILHFITRRNGTEQNQASFKKT